MDSLKPHAAEIGYRTSETEIGSHLSLQVVRRLAAPQSADPTSAAAWRALWDAQYRRALLVLCDVLCPRSSGVAPEQQQEEESGSESASAAHPPPPPAGEEREAALSAMRELCAHQARADIRPAGSTGQSADFPRVLLCFFFCEIRLFTGDVRFLSPVSVSAAPQAWRADPFLPVLFPCLVSAAAAEGEEGRPGGSGDDCGGAGDGAAASLLATEILEARQESF